MPGYNTKDIMETTLKVLDFRTHTHEELCGLSLRAIREKAKMELFQLKASLRRKDDVILFMLHALCS